MTRGAKRSILTVLHLFETLHFDADDGREASEGAQLEVMIVLPQFEHLHRGSGDGLG